MKIKAIMLLRDKYIKTITVDPEGENFRFRNGTYVMKNSSVKIGELGNPEIFYFENNPTPINRENKDDSANYLNEFIKTNFIKQIDATGSTTENPFKGLLALFKDPRIFIGLILGLALLYSFWASGWKII